MPVRLTPFVNGQIYHVFNRGNGKRIIFKDRRAYTRFLETVQYYQLVGPKPKFSHYHKFGPLQPDPGKRIIEIVAYCLMPNHFHFLLKQVEEGGISEFMSKLENSTTKYHNKKFGGIGALLQGQFKSVLVESDEQLIHVSRYIHLNPIASFLVKRLGGYEWSSFLEYVDPDRPGICTKEEILGFFKSPGDYEQFCKDQVSYSQTLESIKHLVLEEI